MQNSSENLERKRQRFARINFNRSISIRVKFNTRQILMNAPTSPSENTSIAQIVARLKSYSQQDLQDSWHWRSGEISSEAWRSWRDWPVAPTNERKHIPWAAGSKILWLVREIVVPESLAGYKTRDLKLYCKLVWWAEDVQIFVAEDVRDFAAENIAENFEKNRIGRGDLFDFRTRLLLKNEVVPGDRLLLALRLVSPAHDDGALVASELFYERSDDPFLTPGWVADEISLYQIRLEDDPAAIATLQECSAVLDSTVFDLPVLENTAPGDRAAFDERVRHFRQQAAAQFPPSEHRLLLLGNTHIDLAWLWDVPETWDVATRTFDSVLKLMAEFPQMTFCHSTPALYAWIEENRPDLFAKIRSQVAGGRWEVVGGLWVEPELNTVSGESIVRQVLYGQKYAREKFGKIATIAWLPDSFGFSWQLPQIFVRGGLQTFVTQKLLWNDTTQFPHNLFWWQSPDGSRILSYLSAPIGEEIDPIKMARYARSWQQKTDCDTALWLYGVGDRGGGPTRDMLQVARQWEASPALSKTQHATVGEFLEGLAVDKSTLPVWNDELYLEFHRGCYTSHGDRKRNNRYLERLLYQTELWSAIATIVARVTYPQEAIESAWKTVLFHQFHDILPGTSIPPVFERADRDCREAEESLNEILATATDAIANCLQRPATPHLEARPILIFDALDGLRSEVIAVDVPEGNWQVCDRNGTPVPSQKAADGKILFYAIDLPSVGCDLYWLKPRSQPERSAALQPDRYILENQFLRIEISDETGDAIAIFDKQDKRQILAKSDERQLQFFKDEGQYWDAWNIDPEYEKHALSAADLEEIAWVEWGEIRQRLRVVRRFQSSTFQQDYVLDRDAPFLKIGTIVDWQERHVLVKAAFSFDLAADFATYEIPYGAIARTTRPQSPAEKAKWEVPLLHWADLSTDGSQNTGGAWGVSLLNDCKYGCDARCDRLRLSLLRGSTWPDPQADLGRHEFTYALYPHARSWQQAETVRLGYAIDVPPQVCLLSADFVPQHPDLPARVSFLDLGDRNLILTALKRSEKDSEKWIARCYECHGEKAILNLNSDIGLQAGAFVDLLEDLEPNSATTEGTISSWTIASFLLKNSRTEENEI